MQGRRACAVLVVPLPFCPGISTLRRMTTTTTGSNPSVAAAAPPAGAPVAFKTAAGAASPAVETNDLTKIYKDFWGRPKVTALDGLSLTIHRGEVFGLLGPNGSG